ncbi:MAG TPA: hypothetical protein VJ732_01835 [Bryobacteraceae bacterium]|nr:hypothetical protein [Bryobacteraceae bacterium]
MRIVCLAVALWMCSASAQAQTAPSVSQVMIYSATMPSLNVPGATLQRAVPSVFTETAKATALSGDPQFVDVVTNPANYSVSRSFVQLSSALNASIATALSIVPLSSPASGVIERKDPSTGAELAESSTLGPIFTERAETIGKHHFYIGFSNQDFHFTRYNGTSLNNLSLLYTGNDPSKIFTGPGGSSLQTVPATFRLGMDVRLSQNIAFLTYGLTDRLDVSLGLPVVHSAIAARTYNGTIYAGNGFGNPTCWCANTFTPGTPTLIQPQIGQANLEKSGFGDLLVRVKGTVFRTPRAVIGVGGDVRFPTGDAKNYLGVGATSVKPFVAVSLYSKPFQNGLVISPHFDVGWQFTGKSILGGQLEGTPVTQNSSLGPINYLSAPFTSTKDFIPDVFSWAVGAELALGHRNTVIADILGNEIGWIHGMPNTASQTIANLSAPTGPNGDPTGAAVPTQVSASGLVSAGKVSFGEYSGSFGYKVKVAGNLIVNFNALIRFDNNALVARFVPLFGLGYSF